MSRPRRGAPGSVRIIGGKWRRRRLTVPDVAGLRPTADRVRETLFNWLVPHIEGAHCLDLYAGSGALGFEAASRGATRVVMVERNPACIAQLQDTATQLAATDLEILHANSLQWLDAATGNYDIVFLDPPFGQGMLETSAKLLATNGLLTREGWVYLEVQRTNHTPAWLADWSVQRTGQTANVSYYLVQLPE